VLPRNQSLQETRATDINEIFVARLQFAE